MFGVFPCGRKIKTVYWDGQRKIRGVKLSTDLISSEENLITPERKAKGDLLIRENLKGFINYAVCINSSIIRKLIEINWLEQHHEIYGMGFLELRNGFRAKQMPRSCAVLLAQWGQGISVGRAGEIYQNVCRGLLPKGIDVICWAMETEYSTARLRRYEEGHYKEYFERLVEVMDEERKRAAEENYN